MSFFPLKKSEHHFFKHTHLPPSSPPLSTQAIDPAIAAFAADKKLPDYWVLAIFLVENYAATAKKDPSWSRPRGDPPTEANFQHFQTQPELSSEFPHTTRPRNDPLRRRGPARTARTFCPGHPSAVPPTPPER